MQPNVALMGQLSRFKDTLNKLIPTNLNSKLMEINKNPFLNIFLYDILGNIKSFGD